MRQNVAQNNFTLQGASMWSVLALAVLCGGVGMSFAAAQNSAPPRPARVRAKLDGFDLTPKSSAPPRRPNQIGGASRGIGGVTLYAPTMGKAYSLTPTFFWSADDPKEEYTFRLSQPAGTDALFEAKVVGGRFTYPATAPVLVPGTTYVWTIQPSVDMMGGPASASVVIVGGAERDAITAALTKAQSATDPAAAQARVYTDQRLWFDAVAAYSDLIQSHPARADLYESRSELYDQLPATSALADADVAKAHP